MRSKVQVFYQPQVHPEVRPWFTVFCRMKNSIWTGQELLFAPRKSLSELNTQLSSVSHFSMSLPLLKDFLSNLEFSFQCFNGLSVRKFVMSNTYSFLLLFFKIFFINLKNLQFNFYFFNQLLFSKFQDFSLTEKLQFPPPFLRGYIVLCITLAGQSAIALSQLCPNLDKTPLHYSTEYIYISF